MSLPDVWNPGTVYLKQTTKEQQVTYTEHNCWNVDKFVSARHVTALAEGGDLEQVTRSDYLAATGRAR